MAKRTTKSLTEQERIEIRVLLDRLPDTHVPLKPLKLGPLHHKPRKEKFSVVEPLPAYPLPEDSSAD